MPSSTELVNVSLSLLGAQPITDLTDGTDQARLANRLLESVIDEVLWSHPWNCATFRETLPVLSETPDFDWLFQYQLPSDPYCLRVLGVNDDLELGLRGDEHLVEGRKLMANVSPVSIRFIGRITDYGQFSGALYKALAWVLAGEMAPTIIGPGGAAERIAARGEQMLRRAQTMDGQEGFTATPGSNPLVDVRHRQA